MFSKSRDFHCAMYIMNRYHIGLGRCILDNTHVYCPIGFKPQPDYKCGPNKNKLLTALIPDKVYFNRAPACKVHDYMYTFPKLGNDDYRKAADLLFKINLKWCAAQQSKTRFGKYLAIPMNMAFFYFVRLFGERSFYQDK